MTDQPKREVQRWTLMTDGTMWKGVVGSEAEWVHAEDYAALEAAHATALKVMESLAWISERHEAECERLRADKERLLWMVGNPDLEIVTGLSEQWAFRRRDNLELVTKWCSSWRQAIDAARGADEIEEGDDG